ncbi:MAG: type II secretion system F family protein [Rubrivivax sp.]|nr:type II secretion system F family protein [Rubrivivax sp.]
MSAWAYRARDAAGVVRQGVLAGGSMSAVARELAGMGLVPVEVKPQGAAPARRDAAAAVRGSAAPSFLERWRKPRPGKGAHQAFGLALRELAALLRAGVPLMRALQLVADSSGDSAVRETLQRLTRDLDNGHTLVAAADRESRAGGLVDSYDVAMLSVGEQTGRLPEAFAELHRHREFTRATQEQMGAALRYPMFVLLTCAIALVVVNLWVIPSFAKVFAQARAELPALTQLLLAMSRTMIRGWPWMLGGAAAVAWGWKHWIDSTRGRLWWDRVKLRLPVVGRIFEGIVLARLASSLSSSIQAGLTITDSLAVTGRTLGNAWYESRIAQMCGELARGVSITASARNMGVLPNTMLQLFAIGEESGSLEELMREMSHHYQGEVDSAVRRLSSTLEPILIWFLGIGVLILALGIFMPMWDLGRTQIR